MMINYQEYVESDIRWIGNIPAHWGLSKIGRHFKLERGRVISNVEIANNVGKYPVYSSQTKNNGQLGSINTYDFDGEYVSWTTDGANAGTCFYRKGKFNVTNVCGLISSFDIEIDYKFLSFFLNLGTKNFVRKDINPKLMNDMLSEIPVLILPIKEQKLISQYLDKKTQQIDSLIKKIEKKIELIQEQKNALITQYVTKGLDPNIEMKHSGVDWIGEIPKHWKVGKLYQYSRLTSGSTPSKDKQEYWGNGIIPWMTSGEINKKFIRSIDLKISKKGFENCTLEILPVGTVMIGLNGQGKTKGTAGILKTETTCNQSLCGIIPNESLNSTFLYYFLESQYKHLRGLVGEGKREGISVSFLSRYPVLIPPQNEQKEIKKNLTLKLDNLEKISFLSQTKVERLKEYRQSLITSVVTGKIRITEDMI